MNLANAIFANAPGTKVRCSRGGVGRQLDLSTTWPASVCGSSYHIGEGAVKLSNIACFMDLLLLDPGEVAVYASKPENGAIYCEIGDDCAYVTDYAVKASPYSSQQHIAWAQFAWELTFGKNAELRQLFKKCLSDWDKGKSVRAENLAALCDSHYYGCLKPRKNVVSQTSDLTDAEMEAAFRSHMFRGKGPAFSSVRGLRQSIYEGTTGQEAASPPAPDAGAVREDSAGLIRDCLDGKYLIPYAWKEEQAGLIPPLDSLEQYVPDAVFKKVLAKIRQRTAKILSRMGNEDTGEARIRALGKDYVNIIISGKPGTGKTYTAFALGAATGMPVYSVSCSHNTDEDLFQGLTVMVDGVPTAVPTNTTECFEKGGILLLEEINLPQPAVMMGALGQAVEYPFILQKNGHIPIRRHPLCIIIGTMNFGTAGSKTVSQPFSNRFKQSYVMDDPEEAKFVSILANTTGEARGFCRWVYQCYDRITKSIAKENGTADVESILLALSLRTCTGAIENYQEGEAPKDAVRDSIIGKIREQDPDVAESCAAILDSFPDWDGRKGAWHGS